MGLAGGIEAGKAFVKFLLDDKEMKSGLRSAGKSMQKWGSIGAAATAPILAALTGCVSAAAKVGSEFADMSARTGIGVEALSELKFAAEQSGTSMGSVERAVKTMQKSIGAAAMGNGTFGQTLRTLGIDLATLQAQSPDQQFTTLATAISKIPDPTMRAAMAAKVFGKSGMDLLPMITAADGGLAGLRERARELGVTMSEEDAAACDALGDALDQTKGQLLALAVQVGVALAGPLTNFLNWASESLTWLINFVKAHPGLVAAIGAITLGVAAASGALVTFGTILTIITLHPIVAALALILGLIVAVATYFGLASTGATDFQKSLDKVKVPGGGKQADPVIAARAAKTQAELTASMANQTSSPTSAEAGRAASEASEGIQEVVRWTRETAQGVQRLVQLVRGGGNGGFFAE